jgi:hypothetical protein
VSYVRKKVVKGIEYHYLVESRWIDGKPRQRVVCYLGRYATVRGAHAHWIRESKKRQSPADAKHAKAMVKKLARFI